MELNQGPILVEVYLHGGHVKGLTRRVEQRRRLVDVLNSSDTALFELEAVTMTVPGIDDRSIPLIAIDKSAILVAIPRETQEQTRHRALLNTGIEMIGAPSQQTPMGFLIPPLYLEGTAYLPSSSGLANKPTASVFSNFFPVTGATLYLPDGTKTDEPIVLLNRDNLTLLSFLSETSQRRVA